VTERTDAGTTPTETREPAAGPARRPVAPRHRVGGGYLASAFGAALGAAMLGVFGAFLATYYGDVLARDRYQIDVIAISLAIAAAGFWLGAVLGCWLMLRLRRRGAARATAAAVALLTAPVIVYFLANVPARGVNLTLVAVIGANTLLVAPLLARVLVVRLARLAG
jgi:hypothetical protein